MLIPGKVYKFNSASRRNPGNVWSLLMSSSTGVEVNTSPHCILLKVEKHDWKSTYTFLIGKNIVYRHVNKEVEQDFFQCFKLIE